MHHYRATLPEARAGDAIRSPLQQCHHASVQYRQELRSLLGPIRLPHRVLRLLPDILGSG